MTNSIHKHQPSPVYASKIQKSGLKVTKRYLQDVKRCAIIVEKM
jgi:hypothetical protein